MSEERLTELEDGSILIRLKAPWRDRTTHIKLSPHELLEKLAALVPKPRKTLLLYHGVFAPNLRLRSMIARYGREDEIDETGQRKSLSKLFNYPLLLEYQDLKTTISALERFPLE